mmetsp:Transcript_88081/g.235660  ORF Transcript_88081/g.235660 Transcript_88081/m.235660 type:complete len:241 (+) Transcript_88081:437-1159(+)
MLITARTASVVCFTSPTKNTLRCPVWLSSLFFWILHPVSLEICWTMCPPFPITNPILSLGMFRVNGHVGLASLQASTKRFIASATTSTEFPSLINQSSLAVVSTTTSAPCAKYCMWSSTPAPCGVDSSNCSSTGIDPGAGVIVTDPPPAGAVGTGWWYGRAGGAARPINPAWAGGAKAGGARPCPDRAIAMGLPWEPWNLGRNHSSSEMRPSTACSAKTSRIIVKAATMHSLRPLMQNRR